MYNPSELYGIQMLEDQFGSPVPGNFWDASEELAIRYVEQISLSLKTENRKDYTMMELGSNQAYYSMLFKKVLGNENTRCVLVEPCDKHLLRGMRHFALNGLEGLWVNEGIGNKWVLHDNAAFSKPASTIQDLMLRNAIPFLDLLHCDIDGSEVLALETSSEALRAMRVRWLVISTHSAELHQRCKDLLSGWGYHLTEDHPTMDVGYDGLLVFRGMT